MNKASSIIGLLIAMVGIGVGATMEGAPVMVVLNPAAMLIVLGGTLGATIAGTSMDRVKAIPKLWMKALNAPSAQRSSISTTTGLSTAANASSTGVHVA